MIVVDGSRRGSGSVPRHAGRGHSAAQLSAHLARARHRQLQEETLRGRHAVRNVHREHGIEAIQGESIYTLFPHNGDPATVTHDLSVDLSGGSQRVMLGCYRTDAHARIKCYKSLRTVR